MPSFFLFIFLSIGLFSPSLSFNLSPLLVSSHLISNSLSLSLSLSLTYPLMLMLGLQANRTEKQRLMGDEKQRSRLWVSVESLMICWWLGVGLVVVELCNLQWLQCSFGLVWQFFFLMGFGGWHGGGYYGCGG